MVFPNIEKIKQDYTDKYVVVDARQPELARFADVVGQVKTVNMSGRALVEFQDYHLNIGWFDIGLDYLKVVDKPLPKEKKEPAKKPAATAASAAVKKEPAKPTGKPSTADILAKLKGGAGGAAKKPADGATASASAKPKPQAEPAKSGKPDRAKMSVADMLAAARGGAAPKPDAGEAASAAGESTPEPSPPTAEVTAPEPAPKSEGGIVKVDKSGMSIEEMLVYCRKHDAA